MADDVPNTKRTQYPGRMLDTMYMTTPDGDRAVVNVKDRAKLLGEGWKDWSADDEKPSVPDPEVNPRVAMFSQYTVAQLQDMYVLAHSANDSMDLPKAEWRKADFVSRLADSTFDPPPLADE